MRRIVPTGAPGADLRSPPAEFDAFVEWLESVSRQLVLLEEFGRDDIGHAVRLSQERIAGHMRTGIAPPTEGASAATRDLYRILVSDHAWFLRSIEQLGWFWSIVEREDHGGHRQALGQYGRILAEAVRRHRGDERRYLREITEDERGGAA